jgi:hypothetical protein
MISDKTLRYLAATYFVLFLVVTGSSARVGAAP